MRKITFELDEADIEYLIGYCESIGESMTIGKAMAAAISGCIEDADYRKEITQKRKHLRAVSRREPEPEMPARTNLRSNKAVGVPAEISADGCNPDNVCIYTDRH